MSEELVVPRASFEIDDPWVIPERCTPARLRRATDGSAPRLVTNVAAWYDQTYLTVLFSGADDHIVATYTRHDDPLYEEDVVEVFLAPERLTRYYELEVSPRGTMFDALIDSPDGVRATMHADRAWTCDGLLTMVRIITESDGARAFDVLLRLPFAALECLTPVDGETWRANFFRIDRHPQQGSEFSAWQPTMRTPADFHVAAAFGTLRFTA
ncbi:MAG TPA: carbohydrate-binding family 9-like protein [Thermoanaerobaculia bacterium]|nr:carbohydrate-binding family 9-like protein [Thermoanaerobaculia bacterium]